MTVANAFGANWPGDIERLSSTTDKNIVPLILSSVGSLSPHWNMYSKRQTSDEQFEDATSSLVVALIATFSRMSYKFQRFTTSASVMRLPMAFDFLSTVGLTGMTTILSFDSFTFLEGDPLTTTVLPFFDEALLDTIATSSCSHSSSYPSSSLSSPSPSSSAASSPFTLGDCCRLLRSSEAPLITGALEKVPC